MSHINVDFSPAQCLRAVPSRGSLRPDGTSRFSVRDYCCFLTTTLMVFMAGSVSHAQPSQPGPGARVITLDDALTLAGPKSEQVTIAEAGVTRAESEQRRAHSEWLPQLSASASYDRALASEFSGIFDSTGPSCTPLTIDNQAPLSDRVAEIERALRDCPPTGSLFGGGTDDEDSTRSLPFGRSNTYRLNLAFSQNVYTGGRLQAQEVRARLGRENAALTLSSTRAQVALDVAQAYFDAVLSDHLAVI